jgi:hypothetical protein
LSKATATLPAHCVEQPLVKSDFVQFWMLLVKAFLQAGGASGGGPGTPTSSRFIAKVPGAIKRKAASTGIRLVDCATNITFLIPRNPEKCNCFGRFPESNSGAFVIHAKERFVCDQ